MKADWSSGRAGTVAPFLPAFMSPLWTKRMSAVTLLFRAVVSRTNNGEMQSEATISALGEKNGLFPMVEEERDQYQLVKCKY